MIQMKSKKTLIVASLMLSSAIVLGACGDKDEITKDVTNNNTSNDIEDTAPGENPADTAESFEFKKFELEVDYPDQPEALDVNYEEEKDSTDAEYKNAADGGSEVTGEEAMAKLKPFLEKLRLKENMSDEVIIDQIVSAFGIKDNYSLIEADITWQNDEKKEIEVKK
jgi:hypothetical protein